MPGSKSFGFEALTADLCANVFELIRPDTSRPDVAFFYGHHSPDLFLEYATFIKLRLVSKYFNQVFQLCPHLSGILLVSEALPPEQHLSLLQWVRARTQCIESLSFCWRQSDKPFVDSTVLQEAVLQAVAPACYSRPGLTTFFTCSVSRFMLDLLRSFRSMTTCTLTADVDHFALYALQFLPNLNTLTLIGPGTFSELYLLPHLTELQLEDTAVGNIDDPPYSCLPTLCTLDLERAGLVGLHNKGLLACGALQVLHCHECKVIAADALDTFQFCSDSAMQVPATMTTLAQLTELHLEISNVDTGSLELDWVYQLTTLRELTLDHAGQCHINSNLTRLHKLTLLDLSSACESQAQWTIKVDWASVIAFETLIIANCVLGLGNDVLSLVSLVFPLLSACLQMQHLLFACCSWSRDCQFSVRCPAIN